MKERICEFQETMLELGLNIHVSRCLNNESSFHFDLVHKERCEACPHRVAITSEDVLADSLVDDVYVELVVRHDEVVEHLLSIHCKECEHFNERDGICDKTR